ncbi:MAG: Hpt domain-containing protein [Dehalococcoidia bacterium]|nr:Hpt domain-containing protein [Dehalococcoidia bacterium]
MTHPATFDETTITQLLVDTGDDVEFVRELVDTFIADAPALLEELRAPAGADLEAQRRAAHSLASNASTLGALELSRLARAVEHQARDGVAPSAAALDVVAAALTSAVASIEALDVWK